MNETTQNLVLPSLRELQNDMNTLRIEMLDGLNRLNVRLSAIEQTLASLQGVMISNRDKLQQLEHRVERIERRLEL